MEVILGRDVQTTYLDESVTVIRNKEPDTPLPKVSEMDIGLQIQIVEPNKS